MPAFAKHFLYIKVPTPRHVPPMTVLTLFTDALQKTFIASSDTVGSEYIAFDFCQNVAHHPYNFIMLAAWARIREISMTSIRTICCKIEMNTNQIESKTLYG